MMLERGLDAGRRQFVERIALIAPILEALEVAVEPCADIAVPLANDHMPARAGKRDRAGEAGRTCTDDRHGLGRFALGDNPALKPAHLYHHRPNTQTPSTEEHTSESQSLKRPPYAVFR